MTLAVVLLQLFQPDRDAPPADPARSIENHVDLPAPVRGILQRSCYDCHSYATRWPWYAYITPVSFFIADHVNHGRSHLNFSDWNQVSGHTDPQETGAKVRSICRQVSEGEMPLDSYLLLHPSARLTEEEISTICRWSLESAGSGR